MLLPLALTNGRARMHGTACTHTCPHARTHAHPRTKQARLETMLVLCGGMSEHRRAVGQRTCIRRQGTADSNPMFTNRPEFSDAPPFSTALVLTRTARSRFPIPDWRVDQGLFSSLGIQARGCGSVPLVPADRGRGRGPVVATSPSSCFRYYSCKLAHWHWQVATVTVTAAGPGELAASVDWPGGSVASEECTKNATAWATVPVAVDSAALTTGKNVTALKIPQYPRSH